MKQRTSLIKRSIALALALVLLVSQANLGIVLHARAAENDASKTIAEIIADNYDLSEAEKNLLKSGYLVSGSFDYKEIPETNSLVTVDTENAKITAEKYEGWTPVKAVITYGGETLDVALTDGVGTYDAAVVGNAFSVKVAYQLNTTVAADVQTALLGAAAILKQGVKNLDDVSAQAGNLYILEQAMPKLVELANTGVETSFTTVKLSEACRNAIYALNDQMTANGGLLNLSKMISEYDAGSKTAYMMTNGAAMQAEVADLVEKLALISEALNTIYDNIEWLIEMGMVSADLANSIKILANNCNTLVEGLASVNADPWAAANSTGLLTDGVDYAALDTLVAALGDSTAVTVKETLEVATTDVKVNMAMWNVTYKVVLNHIVNNEKVEGFAAQTVETLTDGTEAAVLLASLQNLENQLLVSDVYVEGKFDRTVTEIPATLTEDLTIVVTYNPKNFTVVIAGDSAEYPYGWELTLPVHEDAKKSYDYKDANGKYYPQGSVVVVEDNMTFTRTEGKAYTEGNLFAIICNNYGTEKVSAILNSGAVKGNEAISYREPSVAELEELVVLEGSTLTVQSYASSYAGLDWEPYSYVLVSGDAQSTHYFNGAYTVEIADDFDSVQVFYRLTMTNHSEAEVQAIFDLVAELVAEAEGQKSVMDRLMGYESQVEQLKVNMLKGLPTILDDYTDEYGAELIEQTKAVVKDIVNNSFDGDTLKLYNIIKRYSDPNNGGLIYYYQNADEILNEVSYLSEKLESLLNGDPRSYELLAELLESVNYGEYADKLSDLNTKIAEIKEALAPVNAAIDTTNAAKLSALAKALAMEGSVEVAEVGNPYVQMGPVTRAAEKFVIIEVKVLAGSFEETFTLTVEKNTALTEQQINVLKAQIAAFVEGKITTAYYTNNFNAGAELDALVGQALTEGAVFSYTWTAKQYTVKIDGEADQFVTINDLTIDLPVHPLAANGMSYEYTIGSNTAPSGIYTFEKADLLNLFVDGVLVITRVEKNANVEKLVKMVNDINADMGFEALTLVSENGIYTGIEANISAGDMMKLMMGLVLKSGYGYIGLNNEGFIYTNDDSALELSIQTLINAVLNDETFSHNTVIALGENGKGKLVSTNIQLGDSAEKLHYSNLAFTLNLNSVPEQLTNNVDLLKKAVNYIKFYGGNGAMAFELNLPDKAYAAYASALVATGNVAKNDVNGMTNKVPVQFLYDYFTAITGSEMDLTTFNNTLQMLGFNRDLTDYVSNNTYTKLVAAYNQRVTVSIDDEKTAVGVAAPGQKSIDALIGLLGIDTAQIETFLPMLKEYKTGNDIVVKATAKLENLDKTYYALVLDAEADGITNKIEAPSSYAALADATDELAGYSIVILTANVPGNLTISGTTVLDLNGFDVEGTINATGKLFIIDSSMDTYAAGTVENVTGNAVIIAGNYKNNISAMLKDGYYMEGNTVRNAMYTIKEENGTLTFKLNGNFYEDENISGYFPDAKALALDIATDLLLNYFTTAQLSLGGYELVAVNVDDLVGLYASDNRVAELAKQLIGCVTIGEKGYENNVGFEGVVNMILADLLDFEAITNALNNNTALFNYELTTAPWMIEVDHNKEKDYATLDVTYNADLTKTVNVALVVDSQYSDNVAAMTEVLAEIVVKDETFAVVDIPTPTYSDKTLTIAGAGKASMVMDMSKSDKYATVLGVVLAYGNPAKAADVAAAINAGDMDALKVVVDNTSVAEVFTALKKLDRNTNFASMAAKVGVTLDGNDAAELEGKFHLVLCAAGKVLEELDITGMNSKLGALYNEETGYYELTKKDIFRDKEFNVRSYSALVELEADELTLKIKLFGDEPDCLWGDANHDGLVDSDDATLVELYSVDKAPELFCTIRTDVNADGAIDTDDAALIRMYTVGSITVFPAENK